MCVYKCVCVFVCVCVYDIDLSLLSTRRNIPMIKYPSGVFACLHYFDDSTCANILLI